jgi:hypothetical protein
MLGKYLYFFNIKRMAFNPITLEYDKSVQGEMLRKIDTNHKVSIIFFI